MTTTTASPKVKEESQKLSLDTRITLYQLDATGLGGEVHPFTTTSYGDKPVSFDGQLYPPQDIQVEGFEYSAEGALPQPLVRIGNVTSVGTGLVIAYGDLLGAVFRRIRTYKRFLDGEVDADPTATFQHDVFVVSRKSAQNQKLVEFELRAAMDQQGVRLPRRQVMKNVCPLKYRRPDGSGGFDYTKATCPYAGENSYDKNGTPVAASNDVCAKHLAACRLRFGDHAEIPFGGFPGIAQVR